MLTLDYTKLCATTGKYCYAYYDSVRSVKVDPTTHPSSQLQLLVIKKQSQRLRNLRYLTNYKLWPSLYTIGFEIKTKISIIRLRKLFKEKRSRKRFKVKEG